MSTTTPDVGSAPGNSAIADDVLLDVRGLRTSFSTDDGEIRAVDGVDLTIRRGRTLCVVGESGCGKSMTARSILQLVEPPGRVVDGEILLRDPAPNARQPVVDLARLPPGGREIRAVRGKTISMIFQEPMASLSLVHRVGSQIAESLRVHLPLTRRAARDRAIDLLGQVGIPSPRRVVDTYPFQLSGGMRQRVMIAMALSCEPHLLIADEPTTALDVTTQAQIMDLLVDLQASRDMAIMFITHDMGVVAELADDVAVMYLGTVVEKGPVDAIFHDPQHPYTRALLETVPRIGVTTGGRLRTITGTVPDARSRGPGCVFRDRCDAAMPGVCDAVRPPPIEIATDRQVRCLLHGGAEDVGHPENEGSADVA
ncbi:ABC transporter ATP-binding protein [Spiractinospora alimapuensis]|uniref:ABC transporter ATP-binding protein n=1 Tax=Spiractinospora alimapuensis TaxID=2820884 RepID=UPI001F4568F2|nr:ABC transporter ATP-binding protein [Spiractinospora alimapuensis]QVQ50833.1 ABC transporter ATP-binding protein [Spiractinospora alimapuensis]